MVIVFIFFSPLCYVIITDMNRFTITSKNYYRIILILPYLCWAVFALIISIYNHLDWSTLPWHIGDIVTLTFFSIFIWFIPYTILVITLIVLSFADNERKFMFTLNYSPIILAFIIVCLTLPLNPLGLGSVGNLLGMNGEDNIFILVFQVLLFLAVISIVTGYVFVAIFHGLHRLLKNRNIIVEI